MASEILQALAYATLFASAAILVVLLMRSITGRRLGPQAAYRLWLAVPAAALAAFLPGRTRQVIVEAAPVTPVPVQAPLPPASLPSGVIVQAPVVDPQALPLLLVGLWGIGVLLCFALLLRGQRRTVAHFGALTPDEVLGAPVLRMQARGAGPAVIGVLSPRIVIPADFEARFSPREQALILAHERAHLSACDPLINAALAVFRCLNWFNPLAHFAAIVFRVDQELACDAAVIAADPAARRPYAEALLKTQLAPAALPLGCHWPMRSSHALKQRVEMLGKALPSRAARIGGATLATSLSLCAVAGAWAAIPARDVLIQATPHASQAAATEPLSRGEQQGTPPAVQLAVAETTGAPAASAELQPPPAPPPPSIGYTLEHAAALVPLDEQGVAEHNRRTAKIIQMNGRRITDGMEAAVLDADIGQTISSTFLPDNKVIDLRSYLTAPDGKVHDFTTSQARIASMGLVTARVRPGIAENIVLRRTAIALDPDGRIRIGLAHAEADGSAGVTFKGLRVAPGQTVTVPLPGGYSYTVNAQIASLLELQPPLSAVFPERSQ